MNKKILVVDDEPHIIKMLKSRLEAHNYQVVIAQDGEECLRRVVSEKPDLIILDIMLPKMDGYSVLVTLKETRELTGKIPEIPVIVLTARADQRIRDLVEKEHIQSYIIKPFKAEDLLKKIEDLLTR